MLRRPRGSTLFPYTTLFRSSSGLSSLVFRQTLRCLTSRFGALLRDGVAKGFEVPFIIARRLFDILGEHPHHRGLELDERLDCVAPDRGAGGHTALLFALYTRASK